jgi:alginate O-acetyltransferase complex protein AlgI
VLFTSAAFICLFLPVTLTGYFALGKRHPSAAMLWIFIASVFFYSYWNPAFTLLLLASITANYQIGKQISHRAPAHLISKKTPSQKWLYFGVIANLALLAYFKYANFFLDSLHTFLDLAWRMDRVILPIGISFFTFTQIAYLVDTYSKGIREHQFIHYGLFVTYFPHLIAGPVLHHAQMMPQFSSAFTFRFNAENFATGLSFFAIGMLKKIILADGIAPYAEALFSAADQGVTPDFQEAWMGAVAYTLQLYFDFSGYSDMAIGLALMLNTHLPFNFNSPYQATNISAFWRRWHMSLSQFLRDYLYIALGGSQQGVARRYRNLMLTMVLGGLWHGASWSFVVWGFLHGIYLVIHQTFGALCRPAWQSKMRKNIAYQCLSWTITILAVIFAWVVFRAETLTGAATIMASMVHPDLGSPTHIQLWNAGLNTSSGMFWCLSLSAIAVIAPNSNHIGHRLSVSFQRHPAFSAVLTGASCSVVLFLLMVNSMRDSVSAFIYFNF